MVFVTQSPKNYVCIILLLSRNIEFIARYSARNIGSRCRVGHVFSLESILHIYDYHSSMFWILLPHMFCDTWYIFRDSDVTRDWFGNYKRVKNSCFNVSATEKVGLNPKKNQQFYWFWPGISGPVTFPPP